MRTAARAVILAVALTAAASSTAAAVAAEDSGLAFKLNFGVSGYPSDQNIVAGPVTAIGDTPDLFDTRSEMIYHFDQKFGLELYGAVCYPATREVELELGFGYRDLQLEITQFNRFSRWVDTAGGPKYVESPAEALDTSRDNDFRILTIRPAANFTMAPLSGFVPYLSAGFDIMIVRAKTTLEFVRPYVTENPPGHFDLHAGTGGRREALTLNGSQVVTGLDVGTGLALGISRGLSATVGVSYLFQFGKAFGDFGELVQNNPADPAIKGATYSFDGMNVQNVSFSVGVIARL